MRDIAFSCVGGCCTHHYCAGCLLQFAASTRDVPPGDESRRVCPKCRAPLKLLQLDAEFDSLCGGATRRPDDLDAFTVTLQLTRGQHAGITLRNTPDHFGVLVEKVRRRDVAYTAGLREGDLLVWINGQSCRRHADTVELIEKAKASGLALSLVVLPRGPEQPPIAATARTASVAARTGSPPDSPLAALGARLIGEVSWHHETDGDNERVAMYTLRFADGDGVEWRVTRRYSRWRKLYERVANRWPRVLHEPNTIVFPPKTMPTWAWSLAQRSMHRATEALLAERAAGIEAFVRELLERARHDVGNGMGEWLQHWLRHARAEAREAGRGAEATGGGDGDADADEVRLDAVAE